MRAPIQSPCVKTCVLDRDQGKCTGCGRTLDQIARWSGMSDAERQDVMARLRGKPAS